MWLCGRWWRGGCGGPAGGRMQGGGASPPRRANPPPAHPDPPPNPLIFTNDIYNDTHIDGPRMAAGGTRRPPPHDEWGRARGPVWQLFNPSPTAALAEGSFRACVQNTGLLVSHNTTQLVVLAAAAGGTNCNAEKPSSHVDPSICIF